MLRTQMVHIRLDAYSLAEEMSALMALEYLVSSPLRMAKERMAREHAAEALARIAAEFGLALAPLTASEAPSPSLGSYGREMV